MTDIKDHHIFVFGSNLAGIHGAGAARHALQHYGAIWGQGIGLQGRSYAIPTKDENIQTLPLEEIERHIKGFLKFAHEHPEMDFLVTPVGCGLAGYQQWQIKPFFEGMPKNCHFASTWVI
jgi:hypothetical protein